MQELKKRPDIRIEEIEGEIIIFDPRTKYVHHLNPMAGIIWDLYDISPNPEDIAKEIAHVLKTDVINVKNDVLEILDDFRKNGLME